MTQSAERWLERLAHGSAEQYAAIRELREILIRGLRSGLSGRRKTDAAFIEDMVQVALLRIIERLDTFNGRSRFTTWAMAITIRTAYNELRRRDWNNLSLDALKDEGYSLEEHHASVASESPADLATRNDFHSALRELIKTELTPRQRDVLLAELNGMPQEEIVRQLGGNRNSIYKLFHDARKALKLALMRRGIATLDQTRLIGASEPKANS